MTDPALSAAARELVAALNGGDAENARTWCTEGAWTSGPWPLEALCRDEDLLLQAAPVLLEANRRGAVRIVGFRQDGSRVALWLLFELHEDGWRCVEASRSRLDTEDFLTGGAPAERDATPAPPTEAVPAVASTDPALLRAVERLAAALEMADADAGRALSEEGHWEYEGDSPSRLFRQAAQRPCDVAVTAWRVRGERAAVHLRLATAHGADDVWTAWRLRRGLGWKLLCTPSRWEPVGLFVNGVIDDVPRWSALAPDAEASRWAQAVVDASRAGGPGPEGIPEEAFAALGRPPASPGHELRVGETVSLPGVGRAMVRVDVVDPVDDFAVEVRWATLERGAPGAAWRFRASSDTGSLGALLDGLEVPWVEPTPEPSASAEADETARKAVLAAVLEVLAANNVDPATLGVEKMSKEQLEKLLPQIVGSAFGALFATAFKGIFQAAAKPVKAEIALGDLLGQLFGAAVQATRRPTPQTPPEPDQTDEPAAEPSPAPEEPDED